MPTMSKNVVPTLLKMASKSFRMTLSCICFCSFASLEQEQNEAFLKQTFSFNFMSILKLTAPQMREDGSLVAYSDQKKVQASILKEKLNLNLFKGLYERNGFKMESFAKSTNVCIAKSKNVIAILFSNCFKASCPKKGFETGQLGIIVLTYENLTCLLEKCFRSVCVKPENLSLFFKQISLKDQTLSNDDCKITGKPDFPTDLNSNKELQTSGYYHGKTSTKPTGTCFKCLDDIKRKTFFDERRFGLLENCDCVICYGCIRKADGNARVAVVGPIICPVCSVDSRYVASSARWIEGKEKVKFFEDYIKNVKECTPNPTTKDDMCTEKQLCSVFPSTRNFLSRNYDSWVEKCFTVSTLKSDKWTGNFPSQGTDAFFGNNFALPIGKDDLWSGNLSTKVADIWKKPLPMVTVKC